MKRTRLDSEISPDMSRAAMCTGKPGYANAAKAWATLTYRNGRFGKKQRGVLEPYRCPWCHQWHIGGRRKL